MEKTEAFPTVLARFDTSSVITLEDRQSMISDIDHVIEHRLDLLDTGQSTPQYQSKTMLFTEEFTSRPHWQKLADTWVDCCGIYMNQIPNLISKVEELYPTHIRAWFYRSDKSVQPIKPWHSHTPGFLSGVFYLRIPGDNSKQGGTEFEDPRTGEARGPRDIMMLPLENSWLIFPSWLRHRADPSLTSDRRYTVAADMYVAKI